MENTTTTMPVEKKTDMNIGDWLIVFLVSSIPLVNIVMLFIWAFGSEGDKPSRKTFATAALIWFAILFGVSILFTTIFGIGLFGVLSGM